MTNEEYQEVIKKYSESRLAKDYKSGNSETRYWIMREIVRRDRTPYWQRMAGYQKSRKSRQ